MREWACQYKTFIDGAYDSLMTGNLYSKPYTKDQAQEHVDGMNNSPIGQRVIRDFGQPIARLVYREVSPWRTEPATPPRGKE